MIETLKNYYTEKGIEVLIRRLNNLILLRDNQEVYPFKLVILGFPFVEITNKTELENRIKELEDLLLGIKIEEVIKNE